HGLATDGQTPCSQRESELASAKPRMRAAWRCLSPRALRYVRSRLKPFGVSLTATYDAAGNRILLQDSFGGVLTSVYDAVHRLTAEQLNGSTASYGYDATNELTSDGSNNYTYDLNGNRTMTGYSTGTGNELTGDGTWSYSYDSEGNEIKKTKGTNAET